MPNWDAKDVHEWKQKARNEQQHYCNLLGDRDFDEVPKNLLKKKVGYAFFGAPTSVGNDDQTDMLGYNKEQCNLIQLACNKLFKLQNNNTAVHMSTTFLICKMYKENFVFPVIRSLNQSTNKIQFIDSNIRVYKSWKDFLSNNKLPKCMYCYTLNGSYESDDDENVILGFGTSPACDLVSRTGEALDYTGIAVGVGCSIVGVAALFVPIAGPIAAGALIGGVSCGAYGIGRSTNSLIDRGTHGQSISLTDSEARNCWLGILGGALSFGTMGSMNYIAEAASKGYVVGTAGRVFANTLGISSLTMNGFGILNSTMHMVKNYEKNELSALDIFQYTTSILFFSNSLVTMKTASGVIKEVQANVIKDYKSGLQGRSAKNEFAKLARKTRGKEGMHGNAKVIRSIRNIENPKEFFGSLSAIKSDTRGHNVKLTEKGLVNVNREFVVHPTKLVQIPDDMRQQIFAATKDLSFSNKLTHETFRKQMTSICGSQRIQFEFQRHETIKNLERKYGVNNVKDITINGKHIFENLDPFEIDRLGGVLTNTAKEWNADLIDISTSFASSQDCSGIADFVSFTEFACDYINKEVAAKELHYQNEKSSHPFSKTIDFDRKYGIPDGTKRKPHFFNETVNKLKNSNPNIEGSAMHNMIKIFNDIKCDVIKVNQGISPNFLNDNAATYHYCKHKDEFPGGLKTVNDYFKLASSLTGQNISEGTAILSQEGNVTFITFCNNEGAKAVLVMNHSKDGNNISGIATLMSTKK